MYLIKQRRIRASAYFVFGLHAALLLLAAPAARSQNSLPYKVGVAVENITPRAQGFTNCSPSDIPISSTVKTTGGAATVATGVGTDHDGTRSDVQRSTLESVWPSPGRGNVFKGGPPSAATTAMLMVVELASS